MSSILSGEGRWQEALALLEGELPYQEVDSLYHRLGEVCLEVSEWDKAREYFSTALKQVFFLFVMVEKRSMNFKNEWPDDVD